MSLKPRWLFSASLLLFFPGMLGGFGGRIPPQKKIVKIYKTDKKLERAIGFIIFDNLTKQEHNEYLKVEIPKILLTGMKKFESIVILRDEIFLSSWQNQNQYTITNVIFKKVLPRKSPSRSVKKKTESNTNKIESNTNKIESNTNKIESNTNKIEADTNAGTTLPPERETPPKPEEIDQGGLPDPNLGPTNGLPPGATEEVTNLSPQTEVVPDAEPVYQPATNIAAWLSNLSPEDIAIVITNKTKPEEFQVTYYIKSSNLEYIDARLWDSENGLLGPDEELRYDAKKRWFYIEDALAAPSNGSPFSKSELSQREPIHDRMSFFDTDLLLHSDPTTRYAQMLHFDTNLLLSNETLRYDPEKKWFYIYREMSNYQRKLVLKDTLLIPKNSSLHTVFDKLKEQSADFGVYGQIYPGELNRVKLKIFLIRVNERELELIYDKEIFPEDLFEESATLPQLILAIIQNKKSIRNITFRSSIPDAFVYIDDKYGGKTPFTLSAYPKGRYSFSLWHPQGDIDVERSLRDKNFLSNQFLVSYPGRKKLPQFTHIELDEALDNSTNVFYIKKHVDSGQVEINVDKGTNSILHVNSRLNSVFDRQVSFEMPTGQHFLFLSNIDYKPLQMMVEIKKDTLTQVDVIYPEKRPIPKWKRLFFNYDFNSKLFAGFGFILAGASLVVAINRENTQDILGNPNLTEDRRSFYGDRQNREGIAFTTLFTMSLASFTTAIIYRIFKVKSQVNRLHWEVEPGKYFNVQYVRLLE